MVNGQTDISVLSMITHLFGNIHNFTKNCKGEGLGCCIFIDF